MRIPTGDAFLDVYFTVMEPIEGVAAHLSQGLYEQIVGEKHADVIFDMEMNESLPTDPDPLRAFMLSVAATNLHVGILMGLEMARRDGWTG